MKEIVLDTETTGISVKEGHRIVELGCIELENLIPTKNKFHCYLNPERAVSQKAFEVHGYSDDFLAKQKKFDQVVDEFLNFINKKPLIIHNADLEKSILDLLHNSGYPGVKFEKKINFEKLYQQRFN